MHGEPALGQPEQPGRSVYVLVTVTLSDGSTGVAEAPPRPTIYGETAATITAIIGEELAPRLVGQPAAVAWAHAADPQQPHGQGAIDMAVHDVGAKRRPDAGNVSWRDTRTGARQLHPRH